MSGDASRDLATALDHRYWDIILCDHLLEGFTSFQVLDLLKRRECDVPVIILSGVIGEEMAVLAMKSGASDYVMKSALARLAPSVEREVRDASNRRVVRQAEKALRRSQYDLNDFFENAPIGMHWAGPDGAILRVNAAEMEMLGCRAQDIIGHNVMEFFEKPDVAELLVTRLCDGEEVRNCGAKMLRPDGIRRGR